MTSYQHPVNDDWVVLSDYYTADGYAAMTQLLENSATLPTALVAINDNVAMGQFERLMMPNFLALKTSLLSAAINL